MKHIPVLLKETIEGLHVRPNGIYVDATLGRAGHSSALLSLLSEGGHLYCFDQDADALEESKETLEKISSSFTLIHDNFENLEARLLGYGVRKVDGVMFDLGVSSAQFDDADRGFSYRFDARLDMRMNKDTSLTAETIVNTYDFADLAKMFYEYGEEPYAKRIASAIVAMRQKKKISTTFELVDIIKRSLPARELNKKGHPAKRAFQALRIEVNDELGALKKGLRQACSLLNPGGRVALITFHSLEDRIVKNIFKELCDEGEGSRYFPVESKKASYQLVNRKPILPSAEEIQNNNRSHSAKLRIIERRDA